MGIVMLFRSGLMNYNFNRTDLVGLMGAANTLQVLDYMVTNHIFEGTLYTLIDKGSNYRVELVEDYTYNVFYEDIRVLPLKSRIEYSDLICLEGLQAYLKSLNVPFSEDTVFEVEGYKLKDNVLCYVVREPNGDMLYLEHDFIENEV